MNALYGRQSLDKRDSISIESQIEFCKYETRGEEYKVYTDKGFSGKNTERPQFQQMLEDIKNGIITKVIVYKLDRISRSILDFANMMEMFDKYNVEFVSSTEKFDTSTPMGRAMLNICIVFAQLERETIQQRVSDAYHERAKHGFFMGGQIPYGYKRVDTVIDGIKTGKLEIVPEEAEHIETIFNVYSQPTTSVRDVIQTLTDNDMLPTRFTRWSKTTILSRIKSPRYVKADLDIYEFFKSHNVNIVNPPSDFVGTNGCYIFGEKGKGKKSESLDGCTLVLAPHEGLISSDTWLKARYKCLGTNPYAISQKPKRTWLAGKIKCAKCGYALIVAGKKYKETQTLYFNCSVHRYEASCVGVRQTRVVDVEATVHEMIKKKLGKFNRLTKKQAANKPNAKLNEYKAKLVQVDNEISVLMDKVLNANDVLMQYINKRIAELDNEKKELAQKLNKLSTANKQIDYDTITDHVNKWDEVEFDDKRAILDLLVEKILADENGIKIVWKV